VWWLWFFCTTLLVAEKYDRFSGFILGGFDLGVCVFELGREQQIPPLRCGMTNKRAGNGKCRNNANGNRKTTASATADSFASLRNDKQKGKQQQVQVQQ
jgi:hypothetical protein